MKDLTSADLVRDVLQNASADWDNEEIIHLVLEQQVAGKPDTADTLSQRMADAIAKRAGSWVFIIGFAVVLAAWVLLNLILMNRAFDPYPFILLNLVLSCLASIQAPLIMMSQNRQDEKDRRRAENDYRVNLKTEIIIQDLHKKLDLVLEQQEEILRCQREKD